MSKKKLSRYLSYLLRHNPSELDLPMDEHGRVPVDALIQAINTKSERFQITREELEYIVKNDEKGRFRIDGEAKIKASQGHSIAVNLELKEALPPDTLYHGSTLEAYHLIISDNRIRKMNRHGVHLTDNPKTAWQRACRWHGKTPVILKIRSGEMLQDGHKFFITDNNVWIVDCVPADYIEEVLDTPE